ncbi:MAG TPA: LptA/OstA family protein, partial [Candidatus Sulfotelmatobacter sp.]|nr:LptA/OstA family protein [Candidatus Sulfotelmatobacter sp.]
MKHFSFGSVATVVALATLLLASPADAQQVGSVKNFSVAPGDFYDPPYQSQMKSLLQGARADLLPDGRYRLTDITLQTFRPTGERDMQIKAPHCIYDPGARTASSPGALQMQTGDGKFSLEGEGFLWQQTNSSLVISNRVHSTAHPDLVETASTNRAKAAASPSSTIEIFSEQFEYAATPGAATNSAVSANSGLDINSAAGINSGLGVYRGQVRVASTNLNLTGGILKLPLSGRQLQSLIAETNVVITYSGVQATGERAVYAPDTGLLRLTGHPTWRAEQREGRGNELVIDRTNRIFRALGQAWLKMPGKSLGEAGFLPEQTSKASRSVPATNHFVEIFSDDYEFRTNTAVFRERVRASERLGTAVKNKISCKLLTVNFTGTNQLQELVAEQQVVIEQEDKRFTAKKAVYAGTNGILNLTGNPTWRAGQREGKGDLIQVKAQPNEMVVRGNAFARMPADELGQLAPVKPKAGMTNQPAAIAAAPAKAKTRAKAIATQTNQFAEISCQEYSLQPQTALFQGRVRIRHSQVDWTCETLTAQLAPPGQPERRVVAERGVNFDLFD